MAVSFRRWAALLVFSTGLPAASSTRVVVEAPPGPHDDLAGIVEDLPADFNVSAFHLSEEELGVVRNASLFTIAMEMNLLCPGVTDVSASDFDVYCCGYAFRESFENRSQYRLNITVDDRIYVVRLRGALVPESGSIAGLPPPLVENVEPSPCNEIDEPKDGQFVNLDMHTSAINKAKDAIGILLHEACADKVPNGTVIGVRDVLFAQSKVVQGFILRLVVSLADHKHALHEMEVGFNMDAEIEQIIWPKYIKEHGKCSLLHVSTLDSVHLEEIEALSSDPDVGSHHEAVGLYYKRLNGHIPALDKAIPLETPETLASLLERAEESHLPDKLDLREHFPQCFRPSVVSRQGQCGSCWITSTLGAIGDRHCIRHPEAMTDRNGGTLRLSTQQVLSCHHRNGCGGGHPLQIFNSMLEDGLHLVHEHEYPYVVRCFVGQGGIVEDEDLGFFGCMSYQHLDDMDPKKPCSCISSSSRPREQPPCNKKLDSQGRFGLLAFKRLPAAKSPKSPHRGAARWTHQEVNSLIMQNIYEAGSVIAGFNVHSDWLPVIRTFNGQKVYRWDGKAPKMGAHAVVMCGWGRGHKLEPFWIMRNSYGTMWGDNGYYRHFRGENNCNVEGDITVPKVKDNVGRFEQGGGGKRGGGPSKQLTHVKSEVALIKKGAPTWSFQGRCGEPPCKPNLVALLTMKMDPSKEATCCCDTMNYDPPKCLWVPKAASDTGFLDWFFDTGACGRHNFGRGHVRTHEAVGDGKRFCGDHVFGGPEAHRVMTLKPQQVDDRTFQVSLFLKDFPFGKHDVRVQLGEFEHLYNVKIEPKPGPCDVQRLYKVLGLQYFFYKMDEPERIKGAWGVEWSTRSVYQLRVIAKCSAECTGMAHFPNAVAMKQERSDRPNSLLFSQPLETLPPGLHFVGVTARFKDGGEHTRSIEVDVPERLSYTPSDDDA